MLGKKVGKAGQKKCNFSIVLGQKNIGEEASSFPVAPSPSFYVLF
jgi:hypothetical protein